MAVVRAGGENKGSESGKHNVQEGYLKAEANILGSRRKGGVLDAMPWSAKINQENIGGSMHARGSGANKHFAALKAFGRVSKGN